MDISDDSEIDTPTSTADIENPFERSHPDGFNLFMIMKIISS